MDYVSERIMQQYILWVCTVHMAERYHTKLGYIWHEFKILMDVYYTIYISEVGVTFTMK